MFYNRDLTTIFLKDAQKTIEKQPLNFAEKKNPTGWQKGNTKMKKRKKLRQEKLERRRKKFKDIPQITQEELQELEKEMFET